MALDRLRVGARAQHRPATKRETLGYCSPGRMRFWIAKDNPASVAENAEWLSSRRKDGFEYVSAWYWRLNRYRYPKNCLPPRPSTRKLRRSASGSSSRFAGCRTRPLRAKAGRRLRQPQVRAVFCRLAHARVLSLELRSPTQCFSLTRPVAPAATGGPAISCERFSQRRRDAGPPGQTAAASPSRFRSTAR